MPLIEIGDLASPAERFWTHAELFAIMAWSAFDPEAAGEPGGSQRRPLVETRMGWPGDAERRRALLATEAAWLLEAALATGGTSGPCSAPSPGGHTAVPMSAEDIRRRLEGYGGFRALVRAPSFADMQARLTAAFSEVLAAGLVLSLVRRMDLNHRAQLRQNCGPSVSKALNVIKEIRLPWRLPGFPRNPALLREVWRKHKAAAHLCAAFADLALEFASTDADSWRRALFRTTYGGLETFLRRARIYQGFALQFTPHGARKPLLAPEAAWLLPEHAPWPVILVRPARLNRLELNAALPTKPKQRNEIKRDGPWRNA